MSGFLDNLIGRVNGSVATLERRRPSVYEPLAGAATPAFTHESAIAARPDAGERDREPVARNVVGTPPEADAPAASPARYADRARVAARADASSPPRADASEPSRADRETPVSRRAAEPPSVEPHATIVDASRPAAIDAGEAPARPVASVSIAPTASTSRRERVAPPETAASRIAAERARPVEGARRIEIAARDGRDPALVPASAATIRPALVTAARAASFPRQRSLPAADARPSASEPPSVHVTIGRVEVRASQPTPVPQRERAPKGPELSLDAYLRARNGGAR